MSLQDTLAATQKAMSRQFGGAAISYRLFVDAVFDPATGVQVLSYEDVPVRYASRGSASVRDVAGANGLLELGDARFEFPAADLAEHLAVAKAKAVTTSDLIVEGATTYRVVAFEEFGQGTMLRVFARRQG